MHNNNLLLWLFPLSLDGSPLDWFMDLALQNIPSWGHLIEMFIHEFIRLNMELYNPWNTNPMRQPP